MKDAACIVVGGAGGIGCEICRQLLFENSIINLAIIDIQPIPTHLLDELKTRNPRTQIIYFQCDISLKDKLRSTFNEITSIFRKIDILINAAGIFNDTDVELTFKINVFGMIYSTMFGLEKMTRYNNQSNLTQQPIIVNIASIVGLDPCHRLPIYSASKHATIGFSRAYSHDSYYARSGVKIVVLCPGATLTSFGRQFAGNMIVPNENEALNFFRLTPKQSSECVAEHIIQLLKSAKNGSIWVSENGQLSEITMTKYCSTEMP